MPKQTLIWTSLPNGVVPGGLKLSLYLSPRLNPETPNGEGALDLFPFFRNWPEMVRTLSFDVQFEGEDPVTPPNVIIDTKPLDPELWPLLFPVLPVAQTLVRAHGDASGFQDHAGRNIRSFSIKSVREFIEDVYKQTASDPISATNFPSLSSDTPVKGLVDTLGNFDQNVLEIRKGLGKGLAEADLVQQELRSAAARDFYQVHRFYNRRAQAPYGKPDKSKIPPRIEVPKVDFQEVLAMLGDHPALLRKLGIIIDCTVPKPRNPQSRVRITNIRWSNPPAAPPPIADVHTPWTNYIIDEAGFRARPRAPVPKGPVSILHYGMLRLSDTNAFDIHQLEVDGAALKTLDFAINIKKLLGAPPTIAPKDASLPALRTGGFTIARVNRSEQMKTQFDKSKENNDRMGRASLFAEDVTRGYRLDVLYNGTWHSLCRRESTLQVGDRSLPKVTDEGYVKGAAATSDSKPGGPEPKDLYLHEGLFTWDGWSLVAARPGKSISFKHNDVTRTQTVEIENVENDPATPFKIKPVVRVEPESLPRLRFGQTYRFRARAVDLAGNGHELQASIPGGAWVSAGQKYVRYEPLSPPALAPRAPYRPGEQLENMVIRSKMGDAGLAPEHFNPINERHVAPPKTSQTMAEAHGKFDAKWSDADATFNLAARESRTLQDQNITGIELIDTAEVPKERKGVWPKEAGDPLARGQYVVHTGDTIALPYLPDPLALGLALSGHAGEEVHQQAFRDQWPDLRTFRIILKEGPELKITTEGDSNVVIFLRKATILRLRYSSYMDRGRFEDMAINGLMSPEGRQENAKAMAQGRHWMFTPYRTLQVVHAVERPLEEPRLDGSPAWISPAGPIGKPDRLGDTFVSLHGAIKNHSRSTAQVEVRAEWREWVDRLSDPGPKEEPRAGHAFTRQIDYGEDLAEFPKLGGADGKTPITLPPRHELGDTKHRAVRYRGVATTRYREYFPAEITKDVANITFAGELSEDVIIKSSARPDPPRILYIVPTFKWEPAAGGGTTSKRLGRGLRVYMERPWYSSGDGEQLAVLLRPAGSPPGNSDDPHSRYISQWGGDPIWNGTFPNVELGPQHFENGAHAPGPFSLAESESLSVRAVSFTPEYDEDVTVDGQLVREGRRLWYCDIVMKPPAGVYYPFVRLALARYQLNSEVNAHLSRVVRTEFAQLVADRTATINRLADRIDIAVSGVAARNALGQSVGIGAEPPSAPATSAPAKSTFIESPYSGAGRQVRAQIQSRNKSADGELGWKPHGGAVTLKAYVSRFGGVGTLGRTDMVYWRGTIPYSQPPAGIEYRLILREFELFDTDADVREPVESVPGVHIQSDNVRHRLVYLDIMPLT